MPEKYLLFQNYPNPFPARGGSLPAGRQAGAYGGNPSTTIPFTLPKQSRVTIQIYNSLGQHVQTLTDNVFPPGFHHLQFEPNDLPGGIYICRITADHFQDKIKMLYMK
jgi:hypothetical protein